MHGKALKGYLRLASTAAHLALDVGRDTVISGPGKVVVDAAKQAGMQLLPSIHGLQIYKQTGEDKHLWVVASAVVVTPEDKFSQHFAAVAELVPPLDGSRLALACDLYAQALFETSPSAQFISLVTSVEALTEPEEQRTEIVDILGTLESTLERGLDQLDPPLQGGELDSLRERFRKLKKESISMGFRRLAAEYGDPAGYVGLSAEDFAKKAYTYRSQMVHNGQIPESLPLAQLMILAADIIRGAATRQY